MENGLQIPHGGTLINLMLPDDKKGEAIASATKTLSLSDRNACDVELLVVGGFSPLKGFMNENEYYSVVENAKMTVSYLNANIFYTILIVI